MSDVVASGWAELGDGLAKVRPPIESAATLPPRCYSDPAVLERERDLIFRRGWVGLGRADRWSGPGDYAALDLAGVPVLVLRDRQGRLRAFANSCRHRGSLLLEGQGCRPLITCPFHAWVYGLDGRLRAAPSIEELAGFDKSEHGLVSFRAAERHGFAFVCLDRDAPDLDIWLGDFPALHAPWPLERLVTTRRRELEVACNWKAFLEVFNEYYHLPSVHPNSIGGIYAPPDPAERTDGCYASQFGTTEGTGGLLTDRQDQSLPLIPGLEGRNRQGVRYSWVFPNLTFAAGADALWVYDVLPLAADRTRIGMTVCFPPETASLVAFEARAQHYYNRMDTALAEDVPALERHQKGLASPYARQGRFAPSLEPSVASFAFWYAEQLHPGLGASP